MNKITLRKALKEGKLKQFIREHEHPHPSDPRAVPVGVRAALKAEALGHVNDCLGRTNPWALPRRFVRGLGFPVTRGTDSKPE